MLTELVQLILYYSYNAEWDISELDREFAGMHACSSAKNYDMDISLPRTRLVFQRV